VASKQDALEWARKVPFREGEVEVRQVHELEDFPPGEAIEHHLRNRELTQEG
jgi:hypothetical protein